ncbi:MAG: type IV secretion system protein VirB10 [Pseudomonadota bacterium]
MMRRAGEEDPRQSMSQSALDAANAYAAPQVAESGGDRLSLILGAAAMGMLAILVFNQLSGSRESASLDSLMQETRTELELARTQMAQAQQDAASARADADRARRAATANRQRPRPTPVTQARPSTERAQANLRAPALVVDNSRAGAAIPAAADGAEGAAAATVEGLTSSDIFAQRVTAGGQEPVRATVIDDPSRVAPQGTIIAGVLETAINSDLPGFARAVVSEDIRSLDNRTILIPRGSRLIGQYRSGLAIGESRAFVIWTRLLTPQGVSIELASPATDTLGRAGLPGKVDRHFFQRFGAAIVLSVIDAGSAVLLAENGADVVIGSSSQAQAIAAQSLSEQINIPPTVKVKQGKEIRIFLARDLYFPRIDPSQGLRP